MTNEQASAHLARFQKAILGTKRQERSNSGRNVLFRILFDVVATHRDAIPDCRSVLDAMRESSGFDPSERNFRYTVSLAIVSINQSQSRVHLAAALIRECEDRRDVLVLERAAAIARRQNENKEVRRCIGEIVSEWEKQEKFRKELAAI